MCGNTALRLKRAQSWDIVPSAPETTLKVEVDSKIPARISCNMHRFTNADLADMHFIYGIAEIY